MAITLTYLWPTNNGPLGGGNVAPTVAQMILTEYSTVVATVSASAAGDTSAIITHDFGLPASDISAGFPQLTLVPQDASEITSSWFELSENPNFTILGKGTVAAGGAVKVFIQRPHSIVR
jgi:hypothetical protein